jgi:acetolactate synthase-1/2/3 large subunit
LEFRLAATRYGSDLIVDLLQSYGVPYCALNPGASFRGLHDSLVNYGHNSPQLIECPHEEVAVGLAHGYAKAAGRPMAAILHDVVGLLHACMAIYYAYLDRAPVLLLGATGPMDVARRRPHIDWTHTANIQGNAVRDYVKYDDQPFSVDSIPDSFARGYSLAQTDPKGPVYLCYDAALQEDVLDHAVPLPDPLRAGPPVGPAGDPAAMAQIAALVVGAERPLLLAEYTGRTEAGFAALVALAEATAAPVWDLNGRHCFPTQHPLSLTGDEAYLRSADLIVALDVRDINRTVTSLDETTRVTTVITRPGVRIAEVGLERTFISKWSVDFGKFMESDISVLADTAQAMLVLTADVERLLSEQPDRRAALERRRVDIAARHLALRESWQKRAEKDWDKSPVGTARLAHEVWDVIKDEEWVLASGDLYGWARRTWNFDKHYRHNGRALGTGTQIGIALGVALASRDKGRITIDLQPDGDLLYDPAALWVAVKHKIPLLVVMVNNRAYYSDWEHQLMIAKQRGTPPENAHVGMEIDRPAPDFATLARSLGCWAEGPIDQPGDIGPALKRALGVVKGGGVALVDVVTQSR